jgi:hypothetical protein
VAVSGFQPDGFQDPGFQTFNTAFQCPAFQFGFQRSCASPAPVEVQTQGLFLDPPPGWVPEGAMRVVRSANGPLREPVPVVDDEDELWLLGLTDLETH